MSDSPTPEEHALLDRMFTGDCTPEEQEAVEALLGRFPAERMRFETWRSAARHMDRGVSRGVDEDALYRAFVRRVDERVMIDPECRETRSPMSAPVPASVQAQVDVGNRRSKHAWSSKSGLGEVGGWGSQTLRLGLWIGVLLIVIGSLIIPNHRDGEIHPVIWHPYTTGAYQQAIVNFDNGTRVTLAPQTTLRVLQFGGGARMVALEKGEAYFEVAHAAGVPFIVRSGFATAQVLGTSFLVRHDVDDRHVRIAVMDGKVRVLTPARADTGVTLTMGQMGDVTDSTVHVSTTDDLAPGTEWAPGRIMFRDTPLSTVLQTVSRLYGYQFRYADQTFGTQSVTMTVSTRSSAEALAQLERVLAVNVTVVGDTVTLVPTPQRSSRSTPRIRTYDVWFPTREVGR